MSSVVSHILSHGVNEVLLHICSTLPWNPTAIVWFWENTRQTQVKRHYSKYLAGIQGYKKIWKIWENTTDWRTLKRCNNQMLWGIINSSEIVVISLSGGYCGFSSFQRLIVKWNICYSLALLLAILEVKQIRKHHCQLIRKVFLVKPCV